MLTLTAKLSMRLLEIILAVSSDIDIEIENTQTVKDHEEFQTTEYASK